MHFVNGPPSPPPPLRKFMHVSMYSDYILVILQGYFHFSTKFFQSLKFSQHFNNFNTSLNTPYEYPYRTVSVYNNILVNKRRATTVHFSKTVHFSIIPPTFFNVQLQTITIRFICFAVYVSYPDCFYNRQDCYRWHVKFTEDGQNWVQPKRMNRTN